MRKILFLNFLLLFVVSVSFSQTKLLKIKHYYPKDSLAFAEDFDDVDYHYERKEFGKTTMLIHCESEIGNFEFVFKKKILSLERFGGDSTNVYGANGKITKEYNEPYTLSKHNLYALVLLHDHGGVLEKIKFQDFGNEVYWPEFDYANCSISDENKDGIPEFYLAYLGDSDGLDAKPYKQIIYTHFKDSPKKEFIKYKVTSFYPAGNEGDVYSIEYDTNWKKLPKAIQAKSNLILKKHKGKYN
jgi:hypothetical protein